jgi:M6 family metalloprotease-like protein
MLRPTVHLVVLVCLLVSIGAMAAPAYSTAAGQPQVMPPHPRLREAIERGEVVPPRPMIEAASSPTTSQAQSLGFDQPRTGPRQFTDPLKGDKVSLNALAVVVDFSDNVKTVTATYFDTMIFAAPVAGRGSVRDYFSEVSYGTVDIVTVNLPSSMGWQRAPQTYNYYTWANYCLDAPYPHNCQKLAEDIVDAVNGVVNFSNYDNDGDGYAEPIMLIHAGQGAEFTGSTADIWSHSWSLYSARNYDGVTIADYVIMPEYWQTVSAASSDMTIGVFAHEMGHGFWGLPDVYDRDGSSEGVGNWSLMAGGSWNGPNSGGWGADGSSPAWPDAWMRTEMGFVTATPINSNIAGRSIPRAYNNPPPTETVLKLDSAALGAQEYFLVENRQQVSGSYDEYLPGSGLLIWHVDEAMDTYSLQNDYECTAVPHCQCSDSQHFLLALEQADGLRDLEFGNDRGDSGDPFPGSTTNRTWTMLTNPESSSWYACTDTCIGATNVSNSLATMTADLQVSCATPPNAPSGLTATAVSQHQINLSWTDNSTNESGFKIERSPYSPGSWTQIATVGANVTTYPNTGLASGTTYYYRVRAWNAAGDSGYGNEAHATTFAGSQYWIYLPLVLKNFTTGGGPGGVLWDQPLSSVNQNAYVDQQFSDSPTYSSYLADDFTNGSSWNISTIFVPGSGWNGFTSLLNATQLHWRIYADCAGVPCGSPEGGAAPVWTLSLAPTNAQVTITNGSGGYPSNTLLQLASPVNLPAGHWWLVFYPTMSFGSYGQYGRQPADTTNGYWGQFINPGGAFGYGTAWQAWTAVGATQHDIAFRLEGN